MPNPQLIKTLHTYVEATNLIAQLRASAAVRGVPAPVSDEEVRQPDTIMDALYCGRIDTGEALATLGRVLSRLKAAVREDWNNV